MRIRAPRRSLSVISSSDANPLIATALYWDSEMSHCNYEINNSSSSLAALASMGHAANMQGQEASG